MSTPLVSVLVPVRNEERFIRETAAAMAAQRLDGEVEFIFVDGASEDATRAILKELAAGDPRIRVLDNPRQKTPVALNIALDAAQGEYVARMDAHTWYPPDYLALGIERLEQGGVDWVAGPAIPKGSGRWSRLAELALGSPLGQGGSRKWQRSEAEGAPEEFDLDTGVFAGVWRRDLVVSYGGWDEDWHANQDSEMAARFLRDGRRIVCVPAMAASYAPRDDLRGLARQYFRFGWYRVMTARRHPDTLRAQHLVSVGLAVTPAVAIAGPRPLRSLARAGLLAYAGVVGAVSARIAKDEAVPARDAIFLPAVFGAIQFGWGAGFVAASARLGPPLAALVRALSR